MGSSVDITSSFIENAPPGELQDVVKDIKALTSDDDPALIAKLKPAFEKYNEEQMVAVKLPGASDYVGCLAEDLRTHDGVLQDKIWKLQDPPVELTLLLAPGSNIILQQTPFEPVPILRHRLIHLLHTRPHDAKGLGATIIHARLATFDPDLFSTETSRSTFRRALPTYVVSLGVHRVRHAR